MSNIFGWPPKAKRELIWRVRNSARVKYQKNISNNYKQRLKSSSGIFLCCLIAPVLPGKAPSKERAV